MFALPAAVAFLPMLCYVPAVYSLDAWGMCAFFAVVVLEGGLLAKRRDCRRLGDMLARAEVIQIEEVRSPARGDKVRRVFAYLLFVLGILCLAYVVAASVFLWMQQAEGSPQPESSAVTPMPARGNEVNAKLVEYDLPALHQQAKDKILESYKLVRIHRGWLSKDGKLLLAIFNWAGDGEEYCDLALLNLPASEFTFLTYRTMVLHACWTPDCKAVTLSTGNQVVTAGLEDGERFAIRLPAGVMNMWPGWNAEGSLLALSADVHAFTAGRRIKEVPIFDRQRRRLLRPGIDQRAGPCLWHGQLLYVPQRPGGVLVVGQNDFKPVKKHETDLAPVLVGFLGQALVYYAYPSPSPQENASLHLLTEGKDVVLLPDLADDPVALVSGRRIFTVMRRGELAVLSETKQERIFENLAQITYLGGFDERSSKLYYVVDLKRIMSLDVQSGEVTQIFPFASD